MAGWGAEKEILTDREEEPTMMFRDLQVSNFKSFRYAGIEGLGRFNVVIGANASGKSNFIQMFRFLRDISSHGLSNALSLQGGIDYVRNALLPSTEPLRFRIAYDANLELKRGNIGIRIGKVVYEFALRFMKKGRGYTVAKDVLTKSLEFFEPPRGNKIGDGRSSLINQAGKIGYELDLPKGIPLVADDIIPGFLREERLRDDALLLETPFFEFIHHFENFFDRMAVYNFDPRLPKRSASMTGKMDLEEDGSNLALVLKEIISNKETRRKFTNLLKDCLPFVEDLDVEKLGDGSLIFKLRETYAKDSYLPATFVSDGTIQITALIVALYFEAKSLLIIEEPEKNIHPHLITKVVGMMKDASAKKQIIVTTHNPEIVKCAELENILLVSRNREGFSTVSKPGERAEVRAFLNNEVGIEDLFIQNLLGHDNHEP